MLIPNGGEIWNRANCANVRLHGQGHGEHPGRTFLCQTMRHPSGNGHGWLHVGHHPDHVVYTHHHHPQWWCVYTRLVLALIQRVCLPSLTYCLFDVFCQFGKHQTVCLPMANIRFLFFLLFSYRYPILMFANLANIHAMFANKIVIFACQLTKTIVCILCLQFIICPSLSVLQRPFPMFAKIWQTSLPCLPMARILLLFLI